MVVQKPAAKAAVKWHGMLSAKPKQNRRPSYEGTWGGEVSYSCRPGGLKVSALACHQAALQDELLDDVIGHQLGAVHDGITSDVRETTWEFDIQYEYAEFTYTV